VLGELFDVQGGTGIPEPATTTLPRPLGSTKDIDIGSAGGEVHQLLQSMLV
jgi:hypothetical protein